MFSATCLAFNLAISAFSVYSIRLLCTHALRSTACIKSFVKQSLFFKTKALRKTLGRNCSFSARFDYNLNQNKIGEENMFSYLQFVF